jgi:frataxin
MAPSIQETPMSVDEANFHHRADKTINDLAQAIEDELGDEIDVDVENEILTLGLPDRGQYVVNKNAPLRQIWLSSPKSGAWHFDWDEAVERWRSTRGEKIVLDDLLLDELEAITGTRIRL